jgi:hypothetical protein
MMRWLLDVIVSAVILLVMKLGDWAGQGEG